ncbi:glycosyltransferase family 4 protein [Sphingobacterium sp. 2149]|uniref:glycosyltransferase family 4 protein n=1 Tax=Sphingobacterium sp. 2149 TaxID=2817763 RepID=UPI001AE7614A|nr:glycosyltransferase family 4 protein [Sphingobacterium sp. 2149]MDR6733709.1 glycosyltransferase involved in cell wall biosynthesis [Sphingobacterium sp. 2149]
MKVPVKDKSYKVLFLVFHGFSEHNGVSKKIWGQINGLKSNGVDVQLCYYTVERNGSRVWKIGDEILMDFGRGPIAKIRKRIDYRAISEYVRKNKFQLIYIRSDHNANPFTLNMVKMMRLSGAKVLLEIPTYPYDQEYVTLRMRLELAIDRLYRKKLAKQLDALVTFSDARTIFGQRAIRISNGIDFSAIPVRKPQEGVEKRIIHLLGVAEIHYWHGFDRLVRGLGIYKQSHPDCQVIFHLVGRFSGERERSSILEPITQFNLQQEVVLHGPLWGDELDAMFNLADFAIGSLGRHRSGIQVIKTLKNREYAARGIPFIYSETDADFDGRPYVIKAGPDESAINITKILEFLKKEKFDPACIRNSILDLSWAEQMNKVLQAI